MILPDSSVYFATCTTVDGVDMGVVKIGLSYDPAERMKMLAATEPFQCELICSTPGDMFLEYFVHMWLNEYRVAGEYFRKSPELDRLIHSVKKTGKLPFPIKFVSKEGTFVDLDAAQYMARTGITFRDIERSTGVSGQHHKKLLEKRPCGNRRFLAALAVTAVRKGLTIRWSRDFKPPEPVEKAA